MKCIIRVLGQPDTPIDGEFEDMILAGATAASKICCKDSKEVKFYILEQNGVMLYRNFVSHVNE